MLSVEGRLYQIRLTVALTRVLRKTVANKTQTSLKVGLNPNETLLEQGLVYPSLGLIPWPQAQRETHPMASSAARNTSHGLKRSEKHIPGRKGPSLLSGKCHPSSAALRFISGPPLRDLFQFNCLCERSQHSPPFPNRGKLVIMKTKLTAFIILILLLSGSCSLLPGSEDEGDKLQETAFPARAERSEAAALAPENTWWQPDLDTSWQWQLSGDTDTSYDVDLYDLDLFETSPALIEQLHQQGRYVVCYLSAGSWEDWRPDADSFPPQVLGKNYTGWPGEKWLDIRQIDILAPILLARLDLCAAKGFDGVEPDNIDGYTNKTGFPLSYQDQLAFNIWLAQEAHARGLSIGLKNDPQQIPDLHPYFDWALTEDCFDEGWCADLHPFIAAGKPVFAAEYTDTGITLANFCPRAAELRFNAILKNRDLDAYRESCP